MQYNCCPSTAGVINWMKDWRARGQGDGKLYSAEETDLQMKMRDDDHFGTGDGSAISGPEEHTEMGLPNLWNDRNALEPAGDSADQGLADGGNVTIGVTRLVLLVWCQGRRKAEEVKHITPLRMEQTCETVIQATKNSLENGLDMGDLRPD